MSIFFFKTYSNWSEKKVIVTNVERKSLYLSTSVVHDSSTKRVSESIIFEFISFPKYKRKSIAFDNGRKFAHYYDMEREAHITTYFARPHSPRRKMNEGKY